VIGNPPGKPGLQDGVQIGRHSDRAAGGTRERAFGTRGF
jgi:hypothetical protein